MPGWSLAGIHHIYNINNINLVGETWEYAYNRFYTLGLETNILLGSGNISSNRSKLIYLIDFGVSKKYKNPDGTHVQFKMDIPFTGNVVFASVNSFLNYGNLYCN